MLKFMLVIMAVVSIRTAADAEILEKTICGINEYLETCPPTCPPETCAAIGKRYECPIQPPPNCKPSCRCRLNYRRDDWGVCRPVQDCPPLNCTGQNEVYNPCPPICPRDTCDDASLNGVCPFRIGTILICQPGCTCAEGYYRQNNTGLCIAQRDCFSCTGENEEFRQSGPAIQPSCESLYEHKALFFARQRRSGCYCKEGFIRDSKNKCIKVENCYHERCGVNEIRSCGSACDRTCATLNETCPIVNIQCNNMCYCQDGFARDDCGRCIPINQCPDKCTGPNEEWSRNVDCTCKDLDIWNAYQIGVGTPGCRCIDGYVRDDHGICIQAGMCPRCGPLEQYTECGTACPRTCLHPIQKEFCVEICVKGCFCLPGLLRDRNGKCVQPDQCSAIGCNGDFYATYVSCPSPCPDTCRNYKQTNRVCPRYCKQFGCQCNEGFVLDETTGQCVLPANCPLCHDPNAYYSLTLATGCQNTCEKPDFQSICRPLRPEAGCVCKEGFVKNSRGLCVTMDQCDDFNETNGVVWSRFADYTFNDDIDTPQSEIRRLDAEGYRCPNGYIRDGVCIPAGIWEKCGPLEEYTECGSACPATCKSPKVRVCTKQCVVGCFCKEPLVRNERGECIRPEKCNFPLGCNGDINASKKNYNIGCLPTCDNPNALKNCVAIPANLTNGCVCNKGFVYDGISQICIPPNRCLPGCGGDANAQFLPCGNNCPVTCDNFDDPPLCPELCKINAGECGCKAGFVQNKEGKCIRPLQCNYPEEIEIE